MNKQSFSNISSLVSIIIINWNGKHYLKQCLQTIFSQNYKNIEVILVDNGSIDGSVEFAKYVFPKVKIIVNKANLGFAEANNIGFSKSMGKLVLFLNNDTFVSKNFLTELVGVIEQEQTIGGVQSKILLIDDNKKLDLVGSYFTNTGFLYHYGFEKLDSKIYSKQINIFSAKGAAMMFKRDILQKTLVDGEVFDERFFAYFEETDLCHRVWMAGYRIIFAPESIIFHKMGATSSKLENSFVQFHSYKNRINTYVKNLELGTLIKVIPIHLFLCEVGALMYLFKGRFKIAWAINRAIMWNIINLKPTLNKRRYIQKKIRKIADNKFLPLVSKEVDFKYYFYLFSANLKKYKEILSI